MSAPNLAIGVEPSQAGAVEYGSLAGATKNAWPTIQVSLRLDLTNKGNLTLHATKVDLAFGSPKALTVTIPLTAPLPDAASNTPLWLPPGQKTSWWFQSGNDIILPFALSPLAVSVWCDGYDQPATITQDLAPHATSVTAGGAKQNAYLFPSDAASLGGGELWQGSSAVHVAGPGGWELFAYELVVVAYNEPYQTWTELRPEWTPGSEWNPYLPVFAFRAWEKPVFAMADGIVVSAKDGLQEAPLQYYTLPPWTPDFAGNNVTIDHGTERVIYGHLRQGSLAPNLTPGAKVAAGAYLGRVGNSGQSSRPSLHIQSDRISTGALLPLPFRGISVIDRSAVDPVTLEGPWNSVAGWALPPVTSLIAPDSPAIHLPGPPGPIREFFDMDPLARAISSSLYARLKSPDPPGPPAGRMDAQAAALLSRLNPAERQRLLQQLEALQGSVNGIAEIARLLRGTER